MTQRRRYRIEYEARGTVVPWLVRKESFASALARDAKAGLLHRLAEKPDPPVRHVRTYDLP